MNIKQLTTEQAMYLQDHLRKAMLAAAHAALLIDNQFADTDVSAACRVAAHDAQKALAAIGMLTVDPWEAGKRAADAFAAEHGGRGSDSAPDPAEAPACSCGHPGAVGVVHRADGPCHYEIDDTPSLPGPTDQQRQELQDAALALLDTLGAYNDPLSLALKRFVYAFREATNA